MHATQFFEFITRIADDATDGSTVRLPPVLFQPIAAVDVAATVSQVAIAGVPSTERSRWPARSSSGSDEIVRRALIARDDPRVVVADPHAHYYGTELGERSLVPSLGAILGGTHYEEWLSRSSVKAG